MSSYRAVKNCLPNHPQEHSYPVFRPYARLWSGKLWPSHQTLTPPSKPSHYAQRWELGSAGAVTTPTQTLINKATTIFLPTWLEREEILPYVHMHEIMKIYCARTSLRSTLNMLTRTGCYSKWTGKKNEDLWWKNRNIMLKTRSSAIPKLHFYWHILWPVLSWGSRKQFSQVGGRGVQTLLHVTGCYCLPYRISFLKDK